MADLVAFGEAMVRLSPAGGRRLEQSSSLDVHVGGAELNVAVAAARLGLSTEFVSRLPANPLGRMIRNKAREQGVGTGRILWEQGGRAGLYFLEFGAQPRTPSVLYDRADSSMAGIAPGCIPWEDVLAGCRVFHTTGITPALSQSAAEALEEALQLAGKMEVSASFDLNYRASLWEPARAREVLSSVLKSMDILITSDRDAAEVFGLAPSPPENIARFFRDRFGIRTVAVTRRAVEGVWHNRWNSLALVDDGFVEGTEYHLEIVDRMGGGDAFAAGFLYGLLTGDAQKALACGDASAALKHSIPGDTSWATLDEVEELIGRRGDLSVRR